MDPRLVFYAKYRTLTEASLTANSSDVLEWWIYSSGLVLVRRCLEIQNIPQNTDSSYQYQMSGEDYSAFLSILEQDLPHICPNSATAFSYWEMQSFAPDGTPLHGFYGSYITSPALQQITAILSRYLPPSVTGPIQNPAMSRVDVTPEHPKRAIQRPRPNRRICRVAFVAYIIVFCCLLVLGFFSHTLSLARHFWKEMDYLAYSVTRYCVMETMCMLLSPLLFVLGRPRKPRKIFLLIGSGLMILKHFLYTVSVADPFGLGMLFASGSFFVILLLVLSGDSPSTSPVPFPVVLVPIVFLCLGFYSGHYHFPNSRMIILSSLFTVLFFYLLMYCPAETTKIPTTGTGESIEHFP